MWSPECGMRNVKVSVVIRTTSPSNSAFRTPHSAFGQYVGEIIRESHRHRQSIRQLSGAHVVHEYRVVIHGLGRDQGEVEVPPLAQGGFDRRTRKQTGRGHGDRKSTRLNSSH